MHKFTKFGLTSTEALKRLKSDGPNLLPEQKPRNALNIFISVIKEPMIALLVASSLIYFIIGDTTEAILLFSMILFVSGITFLQEKRTENALQSLKDLSSPKAKVIRDGIEKVIPGMNLVCEDIIHLTEGDRVPADAVLIEVNSLSVDESMLTGESLSVEKQISLTNESLTDCDKVYAGTLVVSGNGYAKVFATGLNTSMGKIGHSLATITDQETRIQTETKMVVKIVAFIGLSVCVTVVLIHGLVFGQLIDGIISGIAIAMSMIPEEFPVVLTIFMALGAFRISKVHVLTRNLPTIETLGSATVLCTDKTGTLTRNKMALTNAALLNKVYQLNDSNQLELKKLIETASMACNKSQGDPIDLAIINHNKSFYDSLSSPLKHFPLSPDLLITANLWKKNSTYQIAAKGAPEHIIKLCRLSKSDAKEVEIQMENMASQGIRVLGVASAKGQAEKNNLIDYEFSFEGLIGFMDPIRPEVVDAVRLCQQAGIRIIMITGDHAKTAKSIAAEIGLLSDIVITGPEISNLPQRKLSHLLSACSVCARIMPEQKLSIVQSLQKNGEIVAMTGDGINDAPALKAANMGIAMGLRGTDVAREASDMVLTDDNFSSIVAAIAEGRRIFTNIRKAVGYILAVHVPIALLAIVPLLMGWPSILTPVHIVILELIIDPVCTLVFEAEYPESDNMSRPPRSPKEKLFNRKFIIRYMLYGLAISVAVFLAYYYAIFNSLENDQTRTIAFLTLIVANVALIFAARSETESFITTLKRPNRALWLVILGVLVFIIAQSVFLPLQKLLLLTSITWTKAIVSLSLGLFVLLASEVIKLAVSYNNRR